MPDGNKSSASRLSLSAMLPQATCSQQSRRGLQQASSARHSAEGVPGMDALGGRMDTGCRLSTHVLMLKVVADAQHSHVPSS